MDFIKIIEETGIKKIWVAGKMGMKQSTFSMKLHGERPFTSGERKKLEAILEPYSKMVEG